MRQRLLWATLGLALATLVTLWLVALGNSPWRSTKPAPRGPERVDEASVRTPPDGSPVPKSDAPEERGSVSGARCLRVNVFADTGPLEGARIWLDDRCAVTGADGIAEIGTDELGVVWARVSREGFCEVEITFPGGVDEADAFLVAGVPLHGKVVRAIDGAPVPGAEVHATDRASGNDLCRVLRTDAEGGFTVPGVAPGAQFVVAAISPGFAAAATTGVAGNDGAEVRLVLGDGAKLRGVVRGADGKLAAGVAIRVFPSDDDYLTRNFDSSLMEQARLRAAARTVTDDRGGYVVAGLSAGEHTVLALGTDGASAEARFEVAKDGDAPVVDLTLAPTGAIRVRVLDPDGRPVPGALIAINDAKAKWIYGPRVAHETDARGEGMATGLEPGVYKVLAEPAHWTAARAEVLVERGPPAEVELRVERGVSLEGTVHDPEGHPVAGLEVSFRAQPHDSPYRSKEVVTARDGHFVLDGLVPVPGTLGVSDWADRWASIAVDALPGGPPVAIVVRPLAAVTGRFEPVPPSRHIGYTTVVGESMRTWALDLDLEGRFVLFGIEEGEAATLYFDVPGGCMIRCPVAALAPGERRDLGTLVLAPGRTLRGHACDADGKPWAHTRIELICDDCSIERFTLTDDNGRFSFEHVDPAALVSITVWNEENSGRTFEFEDWTSEPVQELVVDRR